MDTANIALDELVCEPLLDHLRAEIPSHIHEIDLSGDRVEIGRVPQMLYLPDHGLQIFRGRVVPREAILDDTALILVKHACVQDGRSVSYSPADFSYCDDEVCILSNTSSGVFYHWLEEMYKVVILERFGFDGRYIVSRLPNFAYEYLDLVGIARERIVVDIPNPTVFRSAILMTPVCHLDVLAHRGVFFAMRDAIVAADVSKEPLLGERLWLDRGEHATDKTRDVVNAREVEECVCRHGFTFIDMGTLSVRQQLAAVRCAHVIGGPHGSALTHCMFLKEGSTVIECFSPHYINPSVLEICRILDHRYFQIVSANDRQSDVYPYGYKVEIDCSHLELVFQGIEPSGLTTPALGTANVRHRSSGNSSMGRADPLSRQTYEDIVAEHEARIAPALRQIDQDIASNERADGAALKHLRTMRVLLHSGLFDPDFYLQANGDVRSAGRDPLEHYVSFGEREGRWPNRVFWPWYYRLAGPRIPTEQNALEHYIENGERIGRMPNRTFDPRAYLMANDGLSDFVDKPLFHFLKIGQPAGLKTSGGAPHRGEDPSSGGTIAADALDTPSSNPAAPPIVALLEPLSKAAYDAALSEHREKIEPALRRLELAIESAAKGDADPAKMAGLRTMRTLLLSGLFDGDFYLERYADIREAQVDPLEHYVMHGDAEGRLPNPAFFPSYYRREFMAATEAERNALEHYIEEGERSGGKPNSAFDPRVYLAANPGLSEFVDSPLFHYLKIGRAAIESVRGAPSDLILPALEYAEAIRNADQEEHFLLMQAKRALFEKLGPREAFSLYKRVIHRSDHVEIHHKRIESLREFSERRGGAFRQIEAAGERFVVPPPVVVGADDQASLIGHTRSMYVGCLIDARVRSGSNFIEVGDVALLDYESDELARFDDQLDFDPVVFGVEDKAAWIITPPGNAATVEIEEAFTLLGVRPLAFGHWMVEYLPKYLAASLSGALPRVPVLIEAGMPESHRQALELLLPEGVDIIELAQFATARVRRLWCAPGQIYFPSLELFNERFNWQYFVLPPMRFTPILREMARRLDRATTRCTEVERVFLGRSSPYHKLTNQAAIQAAAEARGFQVVYPEQLDFVEQARLLRHARFVVGPAGSALFLSIFARPGTKLCILSYVGEVVAVQAEMTGLFSAIGLDATVVTGPCAQRNVTNPWQSNFEVEEEAFCRFLDGWLQRAPDPVEGSIPPIGRA